MSEKSKGNITLIENLSEFNTEDSEHKSPLKSSEFIEIIIDLSQPLKLRIKIFEEFFNKFGQEESLELINRLSTMYEMSGTKILQEYLYNISINIKISNFIRIIAAKTLCYFKNNSLGLTQGYESLDNICKNFGKVKDIATPFQLDVIFLLMSNKLYKKQSRNYFCNIINNSEIDCDFRYKSILSLEIKDILDKEYFIKEAIFEFFNNTKNRTLYRILAGQYILQKCKSTNEEINHIETTILSFAEDIHLDYNLRADSADVMLKLGSVQNKIIARNLIMILGREKSTGKTIFDNAQNVHISEIEDSIVEILEYLSTINLKTITFESVKKYIEDLLEKEKNSSEGTGFAQLQAKQTNSKEIESEYKEKIDKINISLNRIFMDRVLYSKYNCTLQHVLTKVWSYMSTHEYKEEMEKRLIEELVEMAGTCSTGFLSRLINVISGFGDFSIRISWRDQIVSNLTGRLNARAKDIINTNKINDNFKLYILDNNPKLQDYKNKEEYLLIEFQEKVLMEMSISNDYSSRKNFLNFFRKNMLSIREEMYNEFRNYIDDTSYDLYFKSAISMYETGECC